MTPFLTHRRVYLSHVLRIFQPGHPPRLIARIDSIAPGDLTGWSDPDVALLIEEGRRASDSGTAELVEVRSRAQLAFTTCLVLFGVLAAQVSQLRHHAGAWTWVMFIVSIALATIALAGALAVLVIQVTVPTIHPGLVAGDPSSSNRQYTEIDKQLAHDYSLNARDWNIVSGTERTVLREAILYLTLAGLADAIAWTLLH
jgi:hypothetical protein